VFRKLSQETGMKGIPVAAVKRLKSLLIHSLATTVGLASGAELWLSAQPALALNDYCQVTQADALAKESLRQAVFNNAAADDDARQQYLAVVHQHREAMVNCRRGTWPQTQAIWLRLYPCDLQPGILEAVLDRVVNLGYNQVYVEVFYGGQVLLPEADNRTAWPSVVQSTGYERRDLLAEAIQKGRERGLDVYAWMFTLNFGYSYGQRPDRQPVLALNGRGQTTSAFAKSGSSSNPDEVFVDPYHPQARRDYGQMLQAVLQRRPDGVLFDYVRYPRGVGAHSVVDRVDDLWIYGQASRDTFLQRAVNQQGLELMRRFISRGELVDQDIDDVRALYPNEPEPLWQSRTPSPPKAADAEPIAAATLRPQLQTELWQLSVAHAVQGVIDFLNEAVTIASHNSVPAGAVFFPSGNQLVGTGGYDSRLQYWDRFPTSISWHPMAYSVCGNTGCILNDVRRVLSMAGPGAENYIVPALAGIWGQSTYNRPALEVQMQALRQATPQINAVSHFAYSWQDPEFDRVRKFCSLP
jgi:hypothetical protein